MLEETTGAPVYVAGGTVQAAGGVYLERAADSNLLKLCLSGAFAFVLTSRQMGKSSLMIRTAETLDAEGVRSVILDLTNLGADVTADQWYKGFLLTLQDQLGLSIDAARWWQEHQELGLAHRFNLFLRKVVLTEVRERVVIFVDEIDTTLRLPFTDDFFTAIRYLYNARADTPELARLSFVLLGVATPGDLIKDPERTPFNIGYRVDLKDFTPDEARPLLAGLPLSGEEAEQALAWVLHWTSGHPYLTLRVFQSFTEKPLEAWTEKRVGQRVAELYFGAMSTQDSNLQFVRDMLTKKAFDPAAVLETYRAIRRGSRVQDEELSLVKSWLKLSGVVRPADGLLRVRNRIYEKVFTLEWIRQHLGINWPRVLARTGWAILAALVLGGLPFSFYRYAVVEAQKAQQAEEEARRQTKIAQRQRETALHQREAAESAVSRAERERAAAEGARAEAERLAKEQTALAEMEKRRAEERVQEATAAIELVRAERETTTRERVEAIRDRDAAKSSATEAIQRAEKAKEETLSDLLATQSLFLRNTQPGQIDLASLLAIESLDRSPANAALEQALQESLLLLPETAGRWKLPNNTRFGALSPSGSRALVFLENAARVLDIPPGRGLTPVSIQPNDDLRFSQDGRWLFGFRGARLVRIDTQTGQEITLRSRAGLNDWIDASSLKARGKYLTVSEPNMVHLWNLDNASEVATIKTKAGSRVLAMSLNAQRLMIMGPDGKLVNWALDPGRGTRKRKIPLKRGAASAAAFSESGTWLATSAAGSEYVMIWETTKDQAPRRFYASLGQIISALSFSPDDRFLVAAGTNGVVKIWNWQDPEAEPISLSHEQRVSKMTFSRRGDRLMTVTDGGVARVWRTADWTELARLGSERSMGFSSDGDYLVRILETTAERWKIPDRRPAEPSGKDLIDQVCQRLGRSLNGREWEQYLGDEKYREICPDLPVLTIPWEGAIDEPVASSARP